MADHFADKIQMQNLLFTELSAMFGKEVPLYDKSLLVNKACNQMVCALLAKLYKGFAMSDEQLDRTSGERHGAIRIGKPEEYRWIAAFFSAFGMEPHNFYDMTNVGSKSQPIIATAFRSSRNPEHRIFCSLLMTDYFDPQTRERIEKLLGTREVFSDRAKELVKKSVQRGGLDWSDARDLIREGVTRIFKWTGRARDFQLYQDLCKAGFKIAADIACFEFHHLNHLTPNTLCMDVYTNAMKFCLGEIDQRTHRARAAAALTQLRDLAGGTRDYMKLHFKHLSNQDIDGYGHGAASDAETNGIADTLTKRLQEPDLELSKFKHSGFKDFTEGPPADTPVLLRQDAYKALTEPVVFQQPDGSTLHAEHTARFGEIEERFYATTPAGRALYDQCLATAEAARAKNPDLAKKDYDAYQREYASCFTAFPKTLAELLDRKLVYGSFTVTPLGKALKEKGSVPACDIRELLRLGFVGADGLRYEDFLPISAAGIFASNLGQYGTKSTATQKPVYTKETLERIMERPIIDTDALYSEIEAESIRDVQSELSSAPERTTVPVG